MLSGCFSVGHCVYRIVAAATQPNARCRAVLARGLAGHSSETASSGKFPRVGAVGRLPWFVYIAFTDIAAGSAGHIWLYADSVPKHQLRRLRVRLTLLR